MCGFFACGQTLDNRLYVARAAPASLNEVKELDIQIAAEDSAMKRIASWLTGIIATVLAVLGGTAISAQDKYTVQVPNGLAFSDFRGYEDWRVVAVSQTGE